MSEVVIEQASVTMTLTGDLIDKWVAHPGIAGVIKRAASWGTQGIFDRR
jgi:hypothetical protein